MMNWRTKQVPVPKDAKPFTPTRVFPIPATPYVPSLQMIQYRELKES